MWKLNYTELIIVGFQLFDRITQDYFNAVNEFIFSLLPTIHMAIKKYRDKDFAKIKINKVLIYNIISAFHFSISSSSIHDS